MKKSPKVSVIMPVYNSKNHIKEAIESILCQTFQDYELIIVDDCSNDGTREILEWYKDERIKIFFNSQNMGVAHSRNRALDNCQGEYVAIMDHDDISLPKRLEMQTQFLDKHSEYGVVGGRVQLINEKNEIIKKTNFAYVNPKYIKAIFMFKNVYCNSEVMFRRELVIRNNLRYDDGCYGMEDFLFWVKMSKITQMTNLDELFLKHRIHQNSITSVVSKKFQVERRAKYEEIQSYSWKLSGICIPADVAQTLHKYVGENSLHRAITLADVAELHKAMQIYLRECKQLDNYEENQMYCKVILFEYMKRMENFWTIDWLK